MIARFVDGGNTNHVLQAIDEHTKAVFIESVSSTELLVSDTNALADVAHQAGVPLVVYVQAIAVHSGIANNPYSDNTAGAGGFLLRPIDHGADIVIASAAEWLSISGSNSAGIIIDSGKFDWVKNQKRFPQFFEPSPGFHGSKLWDKFGNLSFVFYSRAAIMRDTGPCLNPFEAFQLLSGLETLSVRLEKISSDALLLAMTLEDHATVAEVRYPGACPSLMHSQCELLTLKKVSLPTRCTM